LVDKDIASSAKAQTAAMADLQERDVAMEDDYDEEADSDFEADGSGADAVSSESDDEEQPTGDAQHRPRKRRKIDKRRVSGARTGLWR